MNQQNLQYHTQQIKLGFIHMVEVLDNSDLIFKYRSNDFKIRS